MLSFTPKFLADATGGRWTREPAGPVTGFTVDSRVLASGQCFVALKTARRDGHDFLGAALEVGAAAALVAAPAEALALPQLVVSDPLAAFQAIAAAHRRTFPGIVIGVTGSAGKTSTKELLALLLSAKTGDVLATAGNLNNYLGVPLTLTRLDPAAHKFAVIEAGIGGVGDMSSLAAMIRPDHAIVTLIGPAHLSELGSLENVAREKALLPAAVPEGGLRVFTVGCLNYDAFRHFTSPGLAVAPNVTHEGGCTQIQLALYPADDQAPAHHRFECRRLSEGMARNAALALTVALRLGVSAAEAQQRLVSWQPAALRGEHVHDHAGRWLYVDCYNANPASMLDAIDAFINMAPAAQPRLFILGGMEELGIDSLAYHRRLGEALQQAMRPQDSAFVLAAAETADAVVAGAYPRNVVAADSLADLRTHFEAHVGSVFIKGSRRYQLESLFLPNIDIAEVAGSAPAH